MLKWYTSETDRGLKKEIIQIMGKLAREAAMPEEKDKILDTLIKWYTGERDGELKREILQIVGKISRDVTIGKTTTGITVEEKDEALAALFRWYAGESGKELKRDILSFLLGNKIFSMFIAYHENDFTLSLQHLIDKTVDGLSWPAKDIQQLEYNLLALREFNSIGVFPTQDFLNVCLARFTDKGFVTGQNMSDKEITSRNIVLQLIISYVINHTQELDDARLNTFLSYCQEYVGLSKTKRSANMDSVSSFIIGMLSRNPTGSPRRQIAQEKTSLSPCGKA